MRPCGHALLLQVPIDTVKTIMQVEGKGGLTALRGKVARHGPTALFHGAMASAAATFAGHWPWYSVFNTLNELVPKQTETLPKLARNAAIGFVATVTSDTVSNSLRVIKTYRQTHAEKLSYAQCVRDIVAKDGITGLMFRGLRTRILANALQGVMFSVLWRMLEDKVRGRGEGGRHASVGIIMVVHACHTRVRPTAALHACLLAAAVERQVPDARARSRRCGRQQRLWRHHEVNTGSPVPPPFPAPPPAAVA